MIKNEKLLLDELQVADAAELHQLMIDNTARFQRFFPKTLAQNTSQAASEAYIQEKKVENASKKGITLAIRDAKLNTIMGLFILKEIDWQAKVGELAYGIGGSFEGKGFTTAAVREFTSFAFTILGLETLQIITHASNRGSVRVAEKCGFMWKQLLIAEHKPPGETPLDMELYEKHAPSK